MRLLAALVFTTLCRGAVTIPVTNTNWFFSPHNSASDGSATLGTNNVRTDATKVYWTLQGAYFKTTFTGTSATLNIVQTGMNTAVVKWSVDNGAVSSSTLTGSGSTIALATGLASASHTLWFVLSAIPQSGDIWNAANPPTQTLQITGLVIDTAATVTAPSLSVALGSKVIVTFGDSITAGADTDGASTLGDATRSWSYLMSRALNAEYGNVGVNGLGWTVSLAGGTNNVPSFPTSWSSYYSGNSRLFSGKLSPIPDYVFVALGQNDSSSVTSAATAWIASARAATNTTTPIFVLVPLSQNKVSDLTAAVSAANDPYVYLINLGNIYIAGLRYSVDGIHPSAESDAWIGAMFVQAVQLALSSAGHSRAAVTFQ